MKLERLQDDAKLAGKPFVPPFINFDREYAIAPKYNLSICRIKKSMSTLMSGVACVLYDTGKFMRNNRSILEVWSQRFCADKNEYRRLNEVKWRMGDAHHTFTKIVVIRDPISRFISFFSNKCIFEAQKYPSRKQCYNCQGNVTCFLEKQYMRFMQHSSDGFSRLRPSYEDKHAAPLSWNCEFSKYLQEYKIVKLAVDPKDRKNGLDNLMNVLKESNVPNSTLEYIEKSALEGETQHATYDSDAHDVVKKQIESDKTIREWLKRIYYLDFVIFDFDRTLIDS
ncbi:hypothetical protein GCK72_005102 [Caenorhabditis remanei]|uniref:Carbohydrate sulfotransferase n=1 Tax=Caenorhabditis remanei TaxID=31234 RepID=A0A6A5HBK8_CAERE|nr:hypothetical protein GCK72_005102 [Caenorhabditis remanei]KAF1765150.1 hypothetical protein GCK72_005102 [Caenorhabditis remanei]